MKKAPIALAALIAGIGAVGIALFASPTPAQAQSKTIDLYKSATCGCCTAWGDAMEKAGYKVTTHVLEYEALDQFNKTNHVPEDLASCHTATMDGKVLVGHMPVSGVEAVANLPKDVIGLSVPGMPIGSLGMEQGNEKMPYEVIAFTKDGKKSVLQSH